MFNRKLLKKSSLAVLLVAASIAAHADTAQERLAAAIHVARDETQATRTELQKTIADLNTVQFNDRAIYARPLNGFLAPSTLPAAPPLSR